MFRTLLFMLLLLTGCGDQSVQTAPSPTTVQPQPEPVAAGSPQSETPSETFQPLSLQRSAEHRASGTQETAKPAEPQKEAGSGRFRIPDDRPPVNSDQLKRAGIFSYESQRLLLLSDLPANRVGSLPELADQLFKALETHFGSLPPATDGSEFQVTGYLISDRDRFENAGLMPDSTFTIKHGRHNNYEFWMFDQEDDYYRRHLLLHEFTHCFMTCESGMLNIPPLWYIEGMAEYFATHELSVDAAKSAVFGVMPGGYAKFEGWGRISEFRRSFGPGGQPQNAGIAQNRVTTLDEISPDVGEYFSTGKQYCGSWAFCWFLHHHPVYRKHFEPLRKVRTRAEFVAAMQRLRAEVEGRLKTDWLLFQESLLEGFDTQRSWPVHIPAEELSGEKMFRLSADREWQDTGIRLQSSQSVTVQCKGRFVINEDPKPWVSEPQGVSVDYFRGQPVGLVVAVLVSADGDYLSSRIPIGRAATIVAPVECHLWLQVNDSCAGRSNNSGHVDVTVQ